MTTSQVSIYMCVLACYPSCASLALSLDPFSSCWTVMRRSWLELALSPHLIGLPKLHAMSSALCHDSEAEAVQKLHITGLACIDIL